MEKHEKLTLLCALVVGLILGLYNTILEKLIVINVTPREFMVDFEKKDYQIITVNNDMLLVNKKNGKTYKLEKFETEEKKYYWYEYRYIARPKGKTKKIYETNKKTNKTI